MVGITRSKVVFFFFWGQGYWQTCSGGNQIDGWQFFATVVYSFSLELVTVSIRHMCSRPFHLRKPKAGCLWRCWCEVKDKSFWHGIFVISFLIPHQKGDAVSIEFAQTILASIFSRRRSEGFPFLDFGGLGMEVCTNTTK